MSWWPFGKKSEEDDLAAFEKALGVNTSQDRLGLPENKEESFDNLSKQGDEAEERRNLYESQKTAPAPQSQPSQSQQSQASSNDMQVLSAKLDTIKAMLDLLNQRLTAIERNVEDNNKQRRVW